MRTKIFVAVSTRAKQNEQVRSNSLHPNFKKKNNNNNNK